MVKYYFLLLAILSACSLSVAIEESDKQSGTNKDTAQASLTDSKSTQAKNEQMIYGKIEAIENRGNGKFLLTVEPDQTTTLPSSSAPQGKTEVLVDQSTQIIQGSERLDKDDLKEGQHVRISFVKSLLGGRVAQTVMLM